MTMVTLDTGQLLEALKAAGVPAAQAAAAVRMIGESQTAPVTESQSKPSLEAAFALIRADLTQLKWLTALLLSGLIVLILRDFS